MTGARAPRTPDWAALRAHFPVTRELSYLNHAGVAPISVPVRDAIARYAALASERGAFTYDRDYDGEIERVRDRAAALLGAQREEVAFVKNTTEGLGIVAAGLAWAAGDRVVTCDLEYPSNVYPWWWLRDRGVETVMLESEGGALPLEKVEAALRAGRVRVVSLSSVEFGSGARNDLAALGALCRAHGALFCVDAIQSVGCLQLDVEACGVDVLAADGHKWLLAPEGCGLFYCRRAHQDAIRPRIVGWRSVADNRDFDTYHLDLQPSAGRYEEGSTNTVGIFGLGAAVDLLLELGVAAVEARVLALTDRLVTGLRERGAAVLSPRDAGRASGIVAFTWPGEVPNATVARLRRERFFLVTRRGAARASPHFYNDEDEIDRLLATL